MEGSGARALLAVGLSVLCIGATTGVAAAEEAPTLTAFTVPNQAAVDNLQKLGYDLAEYTYKHNDGTLEINAFVTDEQKAQLEAMGYTAGHVVETPEQEDAARRHADASWAALADSKANLEAGKDVKQAKSAAAADTVEVDRADYFENYAGRYISIEARASDATNRASTNPTMTAAWDAGPGTEIGGTGRTGVLSPFIDTDPPDGDYYMYHRNIFRVGALGDGPMPSTVRVASSNGGVDTLAVKRWVSSDGKGFPAGYLKDFTTDYVDPQQAYAKIRALAGEFGNLAQIYDLPFKTNGYQRHSQALLGLKTPYTNATGNLGGFPSNSNPNPDETSAIRQGQAVILNSLAWGQDGGNNLTAQLKDPGAPNAPLGVSVAGNAITVNLATDGAGKITSTAAQVVAAINANADAAKLVNAVTYRGNAGAGVVVPNATPTALTDFLKAPTSYPRGPQTVQMIRIGAHRDGTKTGVFLYCQEHAREWATSLVCLETAERLLRNYATDPETKSLLDNLDIFIIPVINADGVAYSRYDFTSQRRNMTNYCATTTPAVFTDPLARNSWGVDINRNFSVGSFFDGYVGASGNCTSDVFAGPGEFSEPESRNEQWVQNTFSNIRFANNIHSYGGYFMWPPGAYQNTGRTLLPYASAGTNEFFDQTANTTLERIQSYRHTTVLPSRTGPVADVLYSAAGNSADEAYYNHGIIGYDFEIGVDRFTGVTLADGTPQVSQVGFTPAYNNEGHDEGQEFANGNIGLLTAARDYELDHSPPKVNAVITPSSGGGVDLTFTQDEPADIYYTTDGSTPTTSSAHYSPASPRQKQFPVHFAFAPQLKYFAVDVKGQASAVQTYVYSTGGNGTVGGSVPATLSLTLGPAATFGAFTPGTAKDYFASTTATVTSSAGDALLSVSDPDAVHPGHLVNGSFFLPDGLQMRARNAHNTGTAYNYIGSQFNLLQYDGPVTNDAVSLEYKQSIRANDALRTGSYSKTLTYTLSTTNP